MSTIYEVAQLAGVSPATVSRVFNGLRVSEEKIRAVRTAADTLNFTPNRTARTLRRQASELIALVIPDIENPYFTELARGVEDVASEAGYSVVLCNSDSQPSKESTYLKIAVSEQMAGIILAAAADSSDLTPVLNARRPVVAVDRATRFDVDGVLMPDRAAGRTAASDLLRAGYRRIACITGPEHIETATERAAGWRQAMSETMTSADLDELLVFSDYHVAGGRESMEQLLALPTPPDAVVVTNNLMGVGAIQVLTERGLTPPEVGVAVFGPLPFSTLSPTALTVVNLPARHMGVTAANMLLDRIRGDLQPTRTVVMHSQIQSMAGS